MQKRWKSFLGPSVVCSSVFISFLGGFLSISDFVVGASLQELLFQQGIVTGSKGLGHLNFLNPAMIFLVFGFLRAGTIWAQIFVSGATQERFLRKLQTFIVHASFNNRELEVAPFFQRLQDAKTTAEYWLPSFQLGLCHLVTLIAIL